MNYDHLCMGCMEVKGAAPVCPLCGWPAGTPQESALHLPPGTLLHEKYLLGRVLGQGGFGITYLARDINLDRKLAVKEYFPRELAYRAPGDSSVLVHSGSSGEPYYYGQDKFLEEAKILARFDGHPNIISVKDFFRANNTAYLVMGYLQGTTLKDYLLRRGAGLSFNEALAVMLPVMDALKAVHAEGLLHRDISPDNIFITAQGLVILLDFGAARHALGEKGRNLSIILKPGYAPEEQYRSAGAQGPWTDIYAVAATFYHALTGSMPPESLDRLEKDRLAPPSHAGVAIGAVQEAALLKALAVRAADRYQSVAAFQEAIWRSTDEPHTAGQSGPAGYTAGRASADPPPAEPAQGPAPQVSSPALPGSGVFNIGRHPSNDLVLDDESVSRYHASVYMQSGRWYIADRGSTHGTLVNGVQIEGPVELAPSDCIEISSRRFTFDGARLLDEYGAAAQTLPAVSGSESVLRVPTGGKSLFRLPGGPKKILPYAAALLIILIIAGIMFSIGLGRHGSLTAVKPGGGPDLAYGTIEFAGGEYTGELKNGVPHGFGTLVYQSSSRSLGYSELVSSGQRKYTGQWQEGVKHGEGTMTQPDGSIVTGIWHNDQYIGPQMD